jgi:diguanylate cyclase (GGDEF)-like protein
VRVVDSLLNSSTRKIDLAFRYGGEEFLILLPEVEVNQAMRVEEIHSKVE